MRMKTPQNPEDRKSDGQQNHTSAEAAPQSEIQARVLLESSLGHHIHPASAQKRGR